MQETWLYHARTLIDLSLVLCALVMVRRWRPCAGRTALTLAVGLLGVAPATWWIWSSKVDNGAWEAGGPQAGVVEVITLVSQTGALLSLCVFAANMRRGLQETSKDPVSEVQQT